MRHGFADRAEQLEIPVQRFAMPDIIEQESSKISAARFESHAGGEGQPPAELGSLAFSRCLRSVPPTTFK